MSFLLLKRKKWLEMLFLLDQTMPSHLSNVKKGTENKKRTKMRGIKKEHVPIIARRVLHSSRRAYLVGIQNRLGCAVNVIAANDNKNQMRGCGSSRGYSLVCTSLLLGFGSSLERVGRFLKFDPNPA